MLLPVSDPPIAFAKTLHVQLDATGNATIAATDVDGGSSDDDCNYEL